MEKDRCEFDSLGGAAGCGTYQWQTSDWPDDCEALTITEPVLRCGYRTQIREQYCVDSTTGEKAPNKR